VGFLAFGLSARIDFFYINNDNNVRLLFFYQLLRH